MAEPNNNVQSGAASATAPVIGAPVPAPPEGRGVAATQEQAAAILSTARRAVEQEGGAAGNLSVKRSLETFLEGRKNRALHHADEADASSSASN